MARHPKGAQTTVIPTVSPHGTHPSYLERATKWANSLALARLVTVFAQTERRPSFASQATLLRLASSLMQIAQQHTSPFMDLGKKTQLK